MNDLPHIGWQATDYLADTLARFQRLRGRPTRFLTGTDEHGQKVQRAAAKAGITPRNRPTGPCEGQELHGAGLDIRYDDFIRNSRNSAIRA